MNNQDRIVKLGMGVLCNRLGGNKETVNSYHAAMGKTIKSIKLEEDSLLFVFEDETKLTAWDAGQSCCESRYMNTDDELSNFVGGILMNLEIRNAANIEGGYDEHEIQFLVVTTSKGVFTIANHNVHNGYYGGFALSLRFEKGE